MNRNEQIDMIIRFYNMKAGTSYKFGTEANRKAVNIALDAADGNEAELRAYLKERASPQAQFVQLCYDFADAKRIAPKPAEAAPADNLNSSINFLGQVVTELLAKTKTSEIKDIVTAEMKDELRKFIADTYGPIERKIELHIEDRKIEMKGVLHEKFDEVMKFICCDEPVLLCGPAGTGKNVICKQVAEALGLDFYFSNSVTQEYKINGFTDAMGVYQESEFYKAFKNGGLFMLDEIDASIPEVLVNLNAAIANRYYTFPAPIGKVEAHKDFRVVAAANTFGLGADTEYVGRNQLDAASLDRFAVVKINYDVRIEETLADGDSDLLNFCRAFRKATAKAGIQTIVSYRAIGRLAKMRKVLDTEELLETCLLRSLDIDDLNVIKDDVRGYGDYSKAFNAIINSRRAD